MLSFTRIVTVVAMASFAHGCGTLGKGDCRSGECKKDDECLTGDGVCSEDCDQPDGDCDCSSDGRCESGCADSDSDCARCITDGRCDDDCSPPDDDCSGDPCDEEGRYDDGTCDRDCLFSDPDCDGVVEPPPVCDAGAYENGACDACTLYDGECAQLDLDPCSADTYTHLNNVCGACRDLDPDCAAGAVVADPCSEDANARYLDQACDGCGLLDTACDPGAVDPCEGGEYGDGTCDACALHDPDCSMFLLNPPLDVRASDGTLARAIMVTWRAHPRATAYRIYRSDSAGTPGTLLTEIPADPALAQSVSPTAVVGARDGTLDDGLTPGQVAFYSVSSVYRTVESGRSSAHRGSAGPDAALPCPANVALRQVSTETYAVTWDTVEGATFYLVRVAGAPGDVHDDTEPLILGGPPADSGGVIAGMPVFASVEAADDDRSSGRCPIVDMRFELTPTLAAPTVIAEGVLDAVRLSWDPVPGADRYVVLWTQDFVTQQLAETSEVSHLDGRPVEGGFYTVRAFASATGENSLPSDPVSAAALRLPAPILDGAAVSATAVSLSWSDVVGAVGYAIERIDGFGGDINVIAADATSPYLDATVIPSSTYRYTVYALSPSGRRGDPSLPREIVTPARLTPPLDVIASQDLTDVVQVSFSPSVDADYYRVYRNDVAISDVVCTDQPSCLFEHLVNENELGAFASYAVAAHDDDGNASLPSDAVFGRGVRIAEPGGLDATGAVGNPLPLLPSSILVTWQPVPGAVGYRIYRANDFSLESVLAGAVEDGTLGEFENGHVDDVVPPEIGVERTFMYVYSVAAVSARGRESLRTNVVTGFTDPAHGFSIGDFFAPPSNAAASVGDPDALVVTWTAAPEAGVAAYDVSRLSNAVLDGGICTSATPAENLGKVPTTFFDDVTAVPGVLYCYLLTSVRDDGLEGVIGTISSIGCRGPGC